MKKYSILLVIHLLLLIPFSSSAQLLQCTQSEKEVATASETLYGTLSTPPVAKKIPLAIIIAGSGASDRNGLADCYKLLREDLCKNNIAAFSYDKKGVAKSKTTLKENDLTLDTFADDLGHWIELFQADSAYSEIILVGHSEGSLLALLAAQNYPSVSKVVSLCGAGRPLQDVLKEQLSTQLTAHPAMREEAFSYIDTLAKGEKIKNVPANWTSLFRLQPFLISSFKYDPAVEITKLKIPVLVVSGTTDLQISDVDATNLSEAQAKSTLTRIENMNHVLKICDVKDQNAQLKYYQDKTIPISQMLVEKIVDFIKK